MKVQSVQVLAELFRLFLCCSCLCGASLCISCEDKAPAQKGAAPESASLAAELPDPRKTVEPPPSSGARPLAPDLPRSEVGALPVAEDFEEEASRSMALENLEAELDRLEAEIASLPN